MPLEMVEHGQRHFLPAAGHDLFLPLYDPLVSLLGGDRARKELIDQARVEAEHRILDIGCGTGTLLLLLKRRYPTLETVGLDPDPNALRRAGNKARRAGVAVQLDQGFADALPYGNNTFDRVFSSFMFHHLEERNRENTLQEVARVLKPGGSFHLLDFTGGEQGSHGLLGRFLHSHARLKDNNAPRILQLMRRAGFRGGKKVDDGSMLFGLLRTSYYRASK
jgi:ubiquinone/menaquinone biosynthesis C-methylase UbiE